jgi:DNA-directed RNA polymerase specialized sigma24 family protein
MPEAGHFTTTHNLVAAAQGGETGAFQALLERYFFVGKSWLEGRALPPGLAAGDILGEVFQDFLSHPRILERFELREAGSFRRFFFAILKNRFLYAFRRTARQKAAVEGLASATEAAEGAPDEEENALWRMNLVRRAILEWSRRCRGASGREGAAALFRELYFGGKPLKDAAPAAGLTLDQAKKLHGKGKREIKEMILELIRIEVADDAHYFDEIRCLFPLGEAPDPASCPPEGRLRGFLAGTLPEKDRGTTAAHLAACPFCPPRLRAIERERP